MRRQTISLIVLVALTPAWTALAKKDPAKERAEGGAEIAKIAGKIDAARKAGNGKVKDADCLSFAKELASVSKDRKIPEGHFNAGVLLGGCGKLKESEEAYKAALDVKSDFAPAIANLGELAFRRGETEAASSLFDRANKVDPKNPQAYSGQAMILFERARANNDQAGFKEAVNRLRRALALDADSVGAYALLALIYYTVAESDRSKLDLAELVCKQAIEVNDKYPQIYNTLGLIKLRKKNVTGALSEFRKAAELDPKYIEAQLNIGAITLSARDFKGAEVAFKATLDAQPQNAVHLFEATLGMAVSVRGQRRVDEAEQWYNKAKALDGKNCAIAYNLGLLYQDYKSNSEADLNKAKALFNDFVTCGRGEAEKVKDAQRRIKDIDDTFKAMAEAKKMEEESKKMQEEMERMQKQQEEQMKQMQQQQPAAPAAPVEPKK